MHRSRYRGVGLIVIMLLLLVLSWQNYQKLALYRQELKYIKLKVEILAQEQDKLIKEHAKLTNQLENFLRITSTGTLPGPGTVAVNPSVVPYKSRLWIQGYGWGKALDTGGAMRKRNDLIDVFMPTYEEAIKWGRQKVVVVWRNEQKKL